MAELPYGAVLFTPEEVTERMSRTIARARHKILPIIVWLEEQGFLEPVPELGTEDKDGVWDEARIDRQLTLNRKVNSQMTDEMIEAVDDYQVQLIATMVRTWEKPDKNVDTILDLPTPKFQALAEACDEVSRKTVVNLEPSPDPKATAADSPA